jgi:N,N'-diacetyllegionaminate synthase
MRWSVWMGDAARFDIAGIQIGGGGPPYLIAEVGVNHNGDPRLAHRLIDAAADATAVAVKFQTFRAELLAAVDAPTAGYQTASAGTDSQLEMLRRLELPSEALPQLAAHAKDRGIEFLSTPFDLDSLEQLVRLGVPALKIGSGDLTNLMLLRASAARGVPVLLSTGMSEIGEIDAAMSTLREAGAPAIALLQCTSSYPAPAEDANLRAMLTLRERYSVPVGYSDHTLGIAVPIAAAALGASIVEKHLTLDRSMAGPDHAASIEPQELAVLAEALRSVHLALGDGVKRPRASEKDVRRVARRSLVARRALPSGTVLAEGDLDARRPADGISPMRLPSVIGRRLGSSVGAGERIIASDLDPPLEA